MFTPELLEAAAAAQVGTAFGVGAPAAAAAPDNEIAERFSAFNRRGAGTRSHPIAVPDDSRDARSERRWLCCVNVASTNGTSAAGIHMRPGVNWIAVSKSQLINVLEKVRTEDRVRAHELGRDLFETKLDDYLATNYGRGWRKLLASTDEVQADQRKALRIAIERFGATSPEAEAMATNRKLRTGLGSISWLVIVDDLDAPATPEKVRADERADTQRTHEAMPQWIAQAVSAAVTQTMREMRKEKSS